MPRGKRVNQVARLATAWLVGGVVLADGGRPAVADPLPRTQAEHACGAGALALPGSPTCLRIGGLARTEAMAGAPLVASVVPGIAPAGHPRRGFASSLRATARIDTEARTATPWGPLRAYWSVKAR